MIQISPLLDVCRAARVVGSGLAVLAPLRRLPGVRIVEAGDSAWIVWDGEMPSVIRALQAAPGVIFYAKEDGHWRPVNAALPDFTVPGSERSRDLAQVLVPTALAAESPPAFTCNRVLVTLVPCRQARPTSALRCSVDALARWCETATSQEIGQLNGAVCGRHVWLRGDNLPALPGADRFWGKLVLSPLGMRPEPDWPENPLRYAAIVDDEEILVLTPEGPEGLPVSAFRPLTRAAVRRLASLAVSQRK